MAKLLPKDRMGVLDYTAIGLLLIGGLNWGLTALGFNAVEHIAGLVFSKIAFILVGLASAFSIYRLASIKVKMEIQDYIAIGLLIAGGLNWGFVAFGFNPVQSLTGIFISRIVYGIVGLSAIYSIAKFIKRR